MLMRNWKQLCTTALIAALAVPAAAQVGEQQPIGQQPSGTVIQEPGVRTLPAEPARPGEARTRPARPGQVRNAQSQELDNAALAAWLLADLQGEIQISKAVAQKTQNEQVKAFAQKMVKEHTAQAEKLRQIAMESNPRRGRPQPGQRQSPPRPGQSSTEQQPGNEVVQVNALQPQPGQPRRQREEQPDSRRGEAQAQPSENPAVALHQQIAEKCTQSKIQALQQAENPEEMNHMYAHGQVTAHMAMLDALQVVEQKAAPELKQFIAQSQQHAKAHLQEAKQLTAQLEQSSQQ